jgi:hypothetical protein
VAALRIMIKSGIAVTPTILLAVHIVAIALKVTVVSALEVSPVAGEALVRRHRF